MQPAITAKDKASVRIRDCCIGICQITVRISGPARYALISKPTRPPAPCRAIVKRPLTNRESLPRTLGFPSEGHSLHVQVANWQRQTCRVSAQARRGTRLAQICYLILRSLHTGSCPPHKPGRLAFQFAPGCDEGDSRSRSKMRSQCQNFGSNNSEFDQGLFLKTRFPIICLVEPTGPTVIRSSVWNSFLASAA